MLTNVRFYIKSPEVGKNYFRIVKYSEDPSGRKYFPFDDERVDSINSAYRSGQISEDEARFNLKQVVASFYAKSDELRMRLRSSILEGENGEILRQYWEHRYGVNFLSDEKATLYELQRAVKVLGDVSLRTARVETIHKALKANCETVSQHRRAVEKINQLLKFIGRPLTLQKPPKPKKKIKHLTKKEVDQLVDQAETQWMRDAVMGLFGTGCRIGEFLAINESCLRDGSVWIDKQIVTRNRSDAAGSLKAPKRNKEGMVEVLPFAWGSITRWAGYDKTARDYQIIYDWVTETSRKLWPKNPDKHISIHDLRHSHAVYLIGCGASLQDVAKNLRNNARVTEDHYAGFQHTDATSQRLRELMKEIQ